MLKSKTGYSFQIAYHLSLVEKFFEMKKGQCKDALEIYKRFLTRMTRVSEFLKVAEVSGPDLVAKVIGTSAQRHVWVDKTSSTCPGYMRMRGQLRVPSPTCQSEQCSALLPPTQMQSNKTFMGYEIIAGLQVGPVPIPSNDHFIVVLL